MGWANAAIDRLRQGQAVTLRPHGHSIAGRVNDDDQVVVEPLDERELRVGDIVLVRLHGHEYLHLVKAVQGVRSLIRNNRGGVNGRIGQSAIAGMAMQVTLAHT